MNSRRALEKAEAIDLQIREIAANPPKESDTEQLSQMLRDLKMKAKMHRTYATNQEERKVKKLGLKLSEFRTNPMPFLQDTSVSRKLR